MEQDGKKLNAKVEDVSQTSNGDKQSIRSKKDLTKMLKH